MKNLKLNVLEQNQLENQEMNALKGGLVTCGCGCLYAGSGGSSTKTNGSANKSGGKFSEQNVIIWCADPGDEGWKDEATWGPNV